MRSRQQHMSDKVLIAGGGSGGHVAPAIAAAEALASNGIDAILAHSSRKTDSQMVEQTIFENIALPATPLSTKPIGFTRFCAGFVRTSRKVRKIIRNNNINCVLATGGFVAAPSLYAARKSSCPAVLLNLDNPPGKANQLAVRWADRILSTVDCNLDNIELIHPPLRQSVINSSSAATCKKTWTRSKVHDPACHWRFSRSEHNQRFDSNTCKKKPATFSRMADPSYCRGKEHRTSSIGLEWHEYSTHSSWFPSPNG